MWVIWSNSKLEKAGLRGLKKKAPEDLLLELSEKGPWLLLGVRRGSGKPSAWGLTGTHWRLCSHGGGKYFRETSSNQNSNREAGGGE